MAKATSKIKTKTDYLQEQEQMILCSFFEVITFTNYYHYCPDKKY